MTLLPDDLDRFGGEEVDGRPDAGALSFGLVVRAVVGELAPQDAAAAAGAGASAADDDADGGDR